MKKLLGLTLALAMIIPPGQASAELLKNFKLSGGIDVQTDANRNVGDFVTRQDQNPVVDANALPAAQGAATATDGTRRTFNDRVNSAQTRLMLGLDWDWLDDVHSRVSLSKNDRTYGFQTGTARPGGAAGTSQTLGTAVGATGTAEANVYIDEAWFKVSNVFGAVDTTLGRQYYGQEGDLIIYYGPKQNLYGLPVTAIDAVRADVKVGDMLSITGLAGKTADAGLKAPAALPAADADVDVRGFNVGLLGMEGVNVDAYIYNQLTHSVGALGDDGLTGVPHGNDNLYVYGVKGKVTMSGFTVGMEFSKNGGENRIPNGGVAITRDGPSAGFLARNGDGVNTGGAATSDNVYVADAIYKGFAWKMDASYKADIEDVASFTPWFHFGFGSGRRALRENRNEGFTAIASDYRPGTIYGRFSNTGSLPLGQSIPCNSLVPGCTSIGSVAGGISSNQGTWSQFPTAQAGLNNRVIWGLGMKVTPAAANQLTVGISWWSFMFQRVTDDGYDTCSTTQACSPADRGIVILPNNSHTLEKNWGRGRGNKHIGSELDFDLTWKHSDNVSFGAGVASFRPGKYIQSIIEDSQNSVGSSEGTFLTGPGPGSRVANNNVTMAYGDVKVRF